MKYIVLILSLFLATALNAQGNDCSKFHTGYFKNLDSRGNTYIKRTKTQQIEWDKMLNKKIYLKIKWIDECTYSLLLQGNNKEYKKQNNITEDKPLVVKITETGPDYYWLSAQMEGGREYKSKMLKIKSW